MKKTTPSVWLLVGLMLSPVAYALPRDCARETANWHRVPVRTGFDVPRMILGMRALFVFPERAAQTFGVASLEGTVEAVPYWSEGNGVSDAGFRGNFVVRLDTGKREEIPAEVFADLDEPTRNSDRASFG